MAAIQRVARQALLTFRCRDALAFTHNMETLKGMMDKITAADINLPVPDANAAKMEESKVFGAPVTHMSIYECPQFVLGVFILNKHGVTIPLHDHPGMYGLCKVLFGSLRVRSYDKMGSRDSTGDVKIPEFKDSYGKFPIMTKFNSDRILNPESEICELSENKGNFHSIQASGGQAAFLDILAPPYCQDEGRDCTYYRELTATQKCKNEITDDGTRWLVQVPQPRDFFCDFMIYNGPSVSPEE